MPDRSTDRLPTIRFGVPLLVLAVLAALPLLPIPGCGGSKPAPGPSGPKPTDVVLRLDGMEFTFAEVDEWADFLRIAYPMAGRKTIVQAVLEQHVIPLRLAERAFPEERAQLLREATEASGVLTNVYELEQAQQGGNLEVQERRKYTRLQPAIPVAAHLFNRMNEGSVSKPLAVPRGFVAGRDPRVHRGAGRRRKTSSKPRRSASSITPSARGTNGTRPRRRASRTR